MTVLQDGRHSSIGNYEVAIGTLPALNDILDWTSVGTNTLFSQILSSTDYGTTYHLSLRVTNGAGLSDLFVSDGQTLVDSNAGLGLTELTEQIIIYPNPASEMIYIEGAENSIISIFDDFGRIIHQSNAKTIDVSSWASGAYDVVILTGATLTKKRVVVK